MTNDMQHFLRQLLAQRPDSSALFTRLEQEYRTRGEAGRQELFLALAAEMATAQAAATAMAKMAAR